MDANTQTFLASIFSHGKFISTNQKSTHTDIFPSYTFLNGELISNQKSIFESRILTPRQGVLFDKANLARNVEI